MYLNELYNQGIQITSNPPTQSQVTEGTWFAKENNLSHPQPFPLVLPLVFQQVFAERLHWASRCAQQWGNCSKQMKFLLMWPFLILVSSLFIKVIGGQSINVC